jgi:surfactin synthase thioesterase subunit
MGISPVPRWLVGTAARSEPVRLYCFPHGGGSVADYVRWTARMPGIEVWGVQLPGRGGRVAEQPVTRIDKLVAAIADEVGFRAPYALFGHSFGALVTYELAVELRRRGLPQPARIFVSGFPAPHLPRRTAAVSHLPDDEFLHEVARRHGGVSEEVLRDPSLRAAVLPALRADYEALEFYVYLPEPKLACPLTVLNGREDLIAAQDLAVWQDISTVPIVRRTFPGGHFYLRERPDQVVRAVFAALRQLIRSQ